MASAYCCLKSKERQNRWMFNNLNWPWGCFSPRLNSLRIFHYWNTLFIQVIHFSWDLRDFSRNSQWIIQNHSFKNNLWPINQYGQEDWKAKNICLFGQKSSIIFLSFIVCRTSMKEVHIKLLHLLRWNFIKAKNILQLPINYSSAPIN